MSFTLRRRVFPSAESLPHKDEWVRSTTMQFTHLCENYLYNIHIIIPGMHLGLRIFTRVFEKIWSGPYGYSGAWGKLIPDPPTFSFVPKFKAFWPDKGILEIIKWHEMIFLRAFKIDWKNGQRFSIGWIEWTHVFPSVGIVGKYILVPLRNKSKVVFDFWTFWRNCRWIPLSSIISFPSLQEKVSCFIFIKKDYGLPQLSTCSR